MNNGGFNKAYTPAPASPVTTFMSKRNSCKPSPVIHSKPVQYHANGTGRDTYIGFNKGGLAVYGGSRTTVPEN